jgi:hypothetical protein
MQNNIKLLETNLKDLQTINNLLENLTKITDEIIKETKEDELIKAIKSYINNFELNNTLVKTNLRILNSKIRNGDI